MKRIIKTVRYQRRAVQQMPVREFETIEVLHTPTICEEPTLLDEGRLVRQMLEDNAEKFGKINVNASQFVQNENSFFQQLYLTKQDKIETLIGLIQLQSDELHCYAGRFDAMERRCCFIQTRISRLQNAVLQMLPYQCDQDSK